MSLDIILWAPNKAALATWAQTHPAANPLMTADGPREGVSYTWWHESGKFMTAREVKDENGDIITPPTYAPGVVALLKLHTSFFENDRRSDINGNLVERFDQDGNRREQWEYSIAAQWIKNNGTPGSMGSVNYYEVDGIRLFRPADVEQFLAANNLPGHVWVDGNSY